MIYRSAVRWAAICFLLVSIAGSFRPIDARPQYLASFQADLYRRAEVDGCGTCHVNPQGGGARNDFGAAFDAASREFTPLLRANFPKHFKFDSVALPDGSKFHFSDPSGKVVVHERKDQRVLLNLAEFTTPKAAPLPAAANRMTFFLTSKGFASGALGGLAGADQQCQSLAKAAGAGDREWHAYLSTSFKGGAAVDAGDRIGAGPWFNAKGKPIARGPLDLHHHRRVAPGTVYTETGESFESVRAAASQDVAVLTGTNPDGTAAPDKNCGNWALTEGEAIAGDPAAAWNAGKTVSCEADAGRKVDLRLYCFAVK